MKPPKKLHDYVHFITIIYGGVMNMDGIVKCIAANKVSYNNGLIGENAFRKAEKYFINLLYNNILTYNK